MSHSSVVTPLLVVSTLSKRIALMIPLRLEKRKRHTEKVQANKKVVPYGNILGQKLPNALGVQPLFVLRKLLPLHTHWVEHNTVVSPCRLSDWSSGPLTRTRRERCSSLRRTRSTRLWYLILIVLFSSASATYTDCSSAWFPDRTKKIRLIATGNSTKQVRFSLKIFDDVLTHLYAVLIIFQHSRSHFCKDFPHAHIFSNNFLNTVLFHVHLTCNHSNSQSMIATHHLLYPLDADRNPACWRPSVPGVIFRLLQPSLNPLCHSKTQIWDMVYLHTPVEAFLVLVTEFFPNQTKNLKFIRCLVFIFHSSVLIAEWSEKE